MMELYKNVKLYYETYNDIMLPGSISIGVYETNICNWIVFDGQHRLCDTLIQHGFTIVQEEVMTEEQQVHKFSLFVAKK